MFIIILLDKEITTIKARNPYIASYQWVLGKLVGINAKLVPRFFGPRRFGDMMGFFK